MKALRTVLRTDKHQVSLSISDRYCNNNNDNTTQHLIETFSGFKTRKGYGVPIPTVYLKVEVILIHKV